MFQQILNHDNLHLIFENYFMQMEPMSFSIVLPLNVKSLC